MTLSYGLSSPAGTSDSYLTGSWRTERPVYMSLLPPCSAACPASEDIQKWLYEAQEAGEGYERAWRSIVEQNPMPAIMGRICYHPCQTACNRVRLDENVGINAVERFLGDEAIAKGWKLPAPTKLSGRRVLVIGSGPAGLGTAYHLRRLGHEVTIREAKSQPGGMMRYGIPEYRLPRDILDAEIARLVDLGIVIQCDSPVNDLVAESADFDATVLTVGAGVGHHIDIPAHAAAKVVDAVAMLQQTAQGDPPLLGRRVVVYGGGNTAMDAARTAKRLGADDTVVVYRRTQAQMPAHEEEYLDAVGEGITVRWLSTIKEVEESSIVVEKMALDESGRPVPTGEYETLDADAVVLAVGQDADLALLEGLEDVSVTDGVISLDEHMMTGRPGLFAAGDAAPGDRTATVAIGQGNIAAHHVDAYLRSTSFSAPDRTPKATYERLNTWYYADAPAQHSPTLEAARRASGFDEVKQGLDVASALFEAQRCMSCGTCFECDNCYGLCPDDVIKKLGPGQKYEIDYDYCKGCGVCAAECPCGAIEMVPEDR